MSRENLRPVFQRVPRWVLVVLLVVVGLPVHVARSTWDGFVEGIAGWRKEIAECLKLEGK